MGSPVRAGPVGLAVAVGEADGEADGDGPAFLARTESGVKAGAPLVPPMSVPP